MIDPATCHRGIFEIGAPLPGYAFPTTVSYRPVSNRLWTASDGIYRSVFLEGDVGVIAFDTFWSPAAARSYRTAIERVLPGREIHTVIYRMKTGTRVSTIRSASSAIVTMPRRRRRPAAFGSQHAHR